MEDRASRRWLRAWLAVHRATLIASLVGIDADTLEHGEVAPGVTVATLLTGATRLDQRCARELRSVDGSSGGGTAPAGAGEPGPSSSCFISVLQTLIRARRDLLDAFAAVDDAFLVIPLPGSTRLPHDVCVLSGRNDRRLTATILRWKEREALGQTGGPVPVLEAALRASRKALLTTVALAPADCRAAIEVAPGRPLWHVLRERESHEAACVRALTSGVPVIRPTASLEQEAPAISEPWEVTWRRFHRTHDNLLRALRSSAEGLPARTYEALARVAYDDHVLARSLAQVVDLDTTTRML